MPSKLLDDQARELRRALNDAFPILECKKALAKNDGHLEQAAQWLTDGSWRHSKAISWNEAAIHSALLLLQAEFTTTKQDLRKVLLDCGGNAALARRKLMGLPILGQDTDLVSNQHLGMHPSQSQLRRFLLFAWNSDERVCGWANFVDSFETAIAAKQHYESANAGRLKLFNDMYEVVDTHAGPKGASVSI